jgi:hypothetical protein
MLKEQKKAPVSPRTNINYLCIALLVFGLFSCQRHEKKIIHSENELLVYIQTTINSEKEVRQKVLYVSNKTYRFNDSLEVRRSIHFSNIDGVLKITSWQREIIGANKVYRVSGYDKLRVVPWLIAEKDTCVEFYRTETSFFAEKNCFFQNIKNNGQINYQFRTQIIPGGAKSRRLYDEKFLLLQEDFLPESIPSGNYLKAQCQLIKRFVNVPGSNI